MEEDRKYLTLKGLSAFVLACSHQEYVRIGDALDVDLTSRFTLAEADVELKRGGVKIAQIKSQIKTLMDDSRKRISCRDLDVALLRLGKTFPSKQLEVSRL